RDADEARAHQDRNSNASWSARLVAVASNAQQRLERVYQGILQKALENRWTTVAIAAVTCAASLLLVPAVGTEFLPPSDEGEVRVTGEMPVGTRLELVDRQTRLIESH